MSERFVEAFVVDPAKLAAALGTPALAFAAVQKKIGKKPIFGDVVATLGSGDDELGLELVKTGLGELAAGKVPTVTYGDRLTSLVLHVIAKPLAPPIMECNHMPADDGGSWSPAFAALGMKTIAKQWGRPTLPFPHKRAPKVEWTWPSYTLVTADQLVHWQRELATPWKKTLATLPNTTFDPDADDDDDDAFMSRSEVEHGIAVLAKWVAKASASGDAMVLVLDGDQ